MEPNRDPLEVPPPATVESTDDALARVEDGDAAGDSLAIRSDSLVTQGDLPAESADIDDGDPQVAPEITVQDPDETLSPAVRRLVRQYDLDITGIHGTGPAGRIRVGDVIGMLGGRDGARSGDARGEDTVVEARLAGTPYRGAAGRTAERAAAQASSAPPATTVYECDLTRVLSHRRAQRRNNVEILITSYYLVACGEALRAVPEAAGNGDGADAQLGVLLTSAEGELRTTIVEAVDTLVDAGPLASFDDRLRSFDQALRAIGDAELRDASFLIHHYGLSGSVLATPTPLGVGHAASLGLGRVAPSDRRERRRRSPARGRDVLRHADIPAGSAAAEPCEPVPRTRRARAGAMARLNGRNSRRSGLRERAPTRRSAGERA